MATTGDRVWSFTSADVSATAYTTDMVRIKRLEWMPNAVDNDINITDSGSERIMATRAKIAAGATREEIGKVVRDFGDKGHDFRGLIIAALDGGTLDVYLA